MNIDKFVEVDSIDPIYYASSYYLAPDGDAGRDVYANLHSAIAETGRVALARVVIGQRERTIAVRAMDGGLVAHTFDEQRDINDARSILGDTAAIKIDPEMVQLAKQLIDRQTTKYDPADLEDRYESCLRALIDAKLKGGGIGLGRADRARPRQRDRPYGGARKKASVVRPQRQPLRYRSRQQRAEACSCPSGRQDGTQTGVRPPPIVGEPALKADLAPALFEADLADEFLIIYKTAQLGVTHATFRATKMPVSIAHQALPNERGRLATKEPPSWAIVPWAPFSDRWRRSFGRMGRAGSTPPSVLI